MVDRGWVAGCEHGGEAGGRSFWAERERCAEAQVMERHGYGQRVEDLHCSGECVV